MPPTRARERALRWGFAASIAATFALTVAYLSLYANPPSIKDTPAFLPWDVLLGTLASGESVALLAAFSFVAAGWFGRPRGVAAPRLGGTVVLAGLVLGIVAHAWFAILLNAGQLPSPYASTFLLPETMMLFSLPIVALGLGVLTFARASAPAPSASAVHPR